jgi:two-component system, cell cycle sensor histidine kinase and response regulator CckA
MNATLPSAQWLERANHLALVAHLLSGTIDDVTNLLQVISGQAELVELGAVDQSNVQRGRSIRRSARRASELLEGVMAFARETRADVEPVDLRQSVERVLALRRASIARAKIEVLVDNESGLPQANANPRVVLQIVLNLVINAEQALSGRQDGRLWVTCGSRDRHIELTVEDNGTGMPTEPATESASSSLGIGLSVSSWLAQSQDGSLTCFSPPNGGCAATLRLPRAV